MSRRKIARSGKSVYWTKADIQTLRRHAGKKPIRQLARMLERTSAAVQIKASKIGISLRQ